MKQEYFSTHISLLAVAAFAFLSGCSSEPAYMKDLDKHMKDVDKQMKYVNKQFRKETSVIKVSRDGTASYSLDGKRFQVLAGKERYSMSINGKHIEVLDGNVTYNGEKIARPENSTLKVTQKHASVFIYVDDKLVREVRIDK
ncbi:MAG: hypothetical protein VW879_09005 [Opitutae bacterium]